MSAAAARPTASNRFLLSIGISSRECSTSSTPRQRTCQHRIRAPTWAFGGSALAPEVPEWEFLHGKAFLASSGLLRNSLRTRASAAGTRLADHAEAGGGRHDEDTSLDGHHPRIPHGPRTDLR